MLRVPDFFEETGYLTLSHRVALSLFSLQGAQVSLPLVELNPLLLDLVVLLPNRIHMRLCRFFGSCVPVRVP